MCARDATAVEYTYEYKYRIAPHRIVMAAPPWSPPANILFLKSFLAAAAAAASSSHVPEVSTAPSTAHVGVPGAPKTRQSGSKDTTPLGQADTTHTPQTRPADASTGTTTAPTTDASEVGTVPSTVHVRAAKAPKERTGGSKKTTPLGQDDRLVARSSRLRPTVHTPRTSTSTSMRTAPRAARSDLLLLQAARHDVERREAVGGVLILPAPASRMVTTSCRCSAAINATRADC